MSFGEKGRGLFGLIVPGLGSGLEPVDSGGTTARTKIVASTSSIRIGSAPLMPGKVSIGKRNQALGEYGLFE